MLKDSSKRAAEYKLSINPKPPYYSTAKGDGPHSGGYFLCSNKKFGLWNINLNMRQCNLGIPPSITPETPTTEDETGIQSAIINTETESTIISTETELSSIIDTKSASKKSTPLTNHTTTISTTQISNTTHSNSFNESCKWITVKCVVYKYEKNDSEMIFMQKMTISNTDLCDRFDPNHQKARIEERNNLTDKKIKQIREKTKIEIERVNEEYKKEIIANKSFGYIAITSITVLVSFVIIMDITKFCLYKKFSVRSKTLSSKLQPKNDKQKMVEDDSVFRKVHKLNEINLKKLQSLKNKS